MKKFLRRLLLISLLSLSVAIIAPCFVQAYSYEENMCVTMSEIDSSSLSQYMDISIGDDIQVSQSGYATADMVFKLFGILPIRSIPVTIITDTSVRAGGNLLGFELTSTGVTILGYNSVMTSSGESYPAKDAGLKLGDTILTIDDISIASLDDLDSIINNGDNKNDYIISYMRDGESFETTISPSLDIISRRYKLGLWVKSNSNGIGTLSYIRNDGRYGAVGHAITDGKTDSIPQNGSVYNTQLLGVQKGTKNAVGELRASIDWSSSMIGSVDTNCEYGIYGDIVSDLSGTRLIEIGGRLSVSTGKAYIRSEIDGNGVQEYEIEIIRAVKQKGAADKSIIFRVTDERLLSTTGGIVQGMSGSPIIQNDMLVGSVTHVFMNDPTKGYGVYTDWMIDN